MQFNDWFKHIAHDYIVVIIAAVLFFAVKAVVGWFTYKHYDRKLDAIAEQVNRLLEQKNRLNRQMPHINTIKSENEVEDQS